MVEININSTKADVLDTIKQHRWRYWATKEHRSSPLKNASDSLKNDREVVFAAVRSYGGALKYASATLKGDKEVVLTAINNWSASIQYASPELRKDPELVLKALHFRGNHNRRLVDSSPHRLGNMQMVLRLDKQVMSQQSMSK